MPRSVARHTRYTRLLATLVVCLLTTAHLATAVHLLLVKHVRCAEHGELIHAAEGDVHDDGAPSPSDQLFAATTLPGEGHSHDHCDLGELVQRAPALPAHDLAPMAWVGPGPARGPPASLATPTGSALFTLAPKQGPPAC